MCCFLGADVAGNEEEGGAHEHDEGLDHQRVTGAHGMTQQRHRDPHRHSAAAPVAESPERRQRETPSFRAVELDQLVLDIDEYLQAGRDTRRETTGGKATSLEPRSQSRDPARELKHDIEAYEDFCALRRRTPGARAEDKLDAGRVRLQARMRRRRRRQRDNARRAGTGRSPYRLL